MGAIIFSGTIPPNIFLIKTSEFSGEQTDPSSLPGSGPTVPALNGSIEIVLGGQICYVTLSRHNDNFPPSYQSRRSRPLSVRRPRILRPCHSHYSANNISESWSGSKDERRERERDEVGAAKLEWMKLKSGKWERKRG